MNWLELARKVVKESQAYECDGMLLDLTTASMLVQVHDALNEKNQQMFAGFSLERAVRIGWKLVS